MTGSATGLQASGMDKTAWDNSPDLRKAIERELDNWGVWSRQGNRVDLGHPHQIPGATPPEHDPPRPVIAGLAEASERVISTWCASTDRGQRAAFLLKLKYVERRPLEKIAFDYRKKFRTDRSDAVVAALIDEAEWCYWMLTS